MTFEIIWTDRAEKDLRKGYMFNIDALGEPKAWEIAQDVYNSTSEILSKDFIPKVADQQFSHLGREYFKIFRGHYKITFRAEGEVRYVLRVFDMRQHPDKNI